MVLPQAAPLHPGTPPMELPATPSTSRCAQDGVTAFPHGTCRDGNRRRESGRLESIERFLPIPGILAELFAGLQEWMLDFQFTGALARSIVPGVVDCGSDLAHPSSNWESSEARTEESAASCPWRPWCGDYRRAPSLPRTRTPRTPSEERKRERARAGAAACGHEGGTCVCQRDKPWR